jgi:hypothetical protein
MAEMTILLVCDPETGKKNILVKLASDAEALPLEHERLHKRLVDKLIEGGTLKANEVGEVRIEREATAEVEEGEVSQEQTPQRREESQSS